METHRIVYRRHFTFFSALMVLGAFSLVGCGQSDPGPSGSSGAASEKTAQRSAELKARSEQIEEEYQEQSQRDAESDVAALIDVREGQVLLYLSSPESASMIPAAEVSGAETVNAAVDTPLSAYEDASIDIIVFDDSISNLLKRLESDPQWMIDLNRVLTASGSLVVVDNPPDDDEEAPALPDASQLENLVAALSPHGMLQREMINLPRPGEKLLSTTLMKFSREPEPI